MLLPGSDNFDGQFVISTVAKPCPRGWQQRQLGALVLNLAPTTNAVPVLDAENRSIGLLIGMPIDLDRNSIVDGQYRLDCRLDDVRNLDDFVEKNIYRLTGSFLFILSALGSRRIYLDADGTLSVVYDQEARVAGATASVLLDTDEYQRRFRAELYKTLDVEDAGWFTAGLTAHEGITRLLCNHYWIRQLDDKTPLASRADRDIQRSSVGLRENLRSHFSNDADPCARRKHQCGANCSDDSRLLLACSRQLLANLTFVTVAAPTADMDVACAKRLARQFGLRHDVLPYREATVAEADLWRFRAGHCVGGNNVKMHPSVEPLEGQYFIGGLGGEVGRGFLWLNAKQDTAIDAKGLVARLKLARTAEVVEAVDAWLAPLAHFDTFLILDLAYLELRMSTWGFCNSYVKPRHHEIHPIISRANYVDMLSLPPELRRKGDIYFQAIEARWKEISKVPINKYGNYKDILRPAKEAIRNPKRASRKVMQIVGAWR